jgi:transcriptional regulator with XRE-family HTH domain
VSASFSQRLLNKLLGKKYRDAYVRENVRTGVAYQIRAMREQRNSMSQEAFGKLLEKPQSTVSRLEDPDYGKHTLQTLFEVAAAFDVALLVQFVTHSEFLRRTENVTPNALKVAPFDPHQLDALRGRASSGVITFSMQTPDVPKLIPTESGSAGLSVSTALALRPLISGEAGHA